MPTDTTPVAMTKANTDGDIVRMYASTFFTDLMLADDSGGREQNTYSRARGRMKEEAAQMLVAARGTQNRPPDSPVGRRLRGRTVRGENA
jgi:hypothetical protein